MIFAHMTGLNWLLFGLLAVAAVSAVARLVLIARVARAVRDEIARRHKEKKKENDDAR